MEQVLITLLAAGLKEGGLSPRKEALFTLRINHILPGNRQIMAKKPATESPVVQGRPESFNPSLTDLNPP